MLHVREREPGREGRGENSERAAVRLHHTAGVAQQSDAEKQQKRQIGQMFQARDGLFEGTTTITSYKGKSFLLE